MQRKTVGMLAVAMAVLMVGAVPSQADIHYTVQPSHNWVGWMNVFDATPGPDALWGSPWTPVDLYAAFTGNGNELEMRANPSQWLVGDDYWVNPDLTGNKFMEANMYFEDASLAGQEANFFGDTIENTFVEGYESQAFIKVLDPNQGWATIQSVFAPLVTGQPFALSLDVAPAAGVVTQFGFVTTGLNADPATYLQLGHALVTPEPTSLAMLAIGGLALMRRRR